MAAPSAQAPGGERPAAGTALVACPSCRTDNPESAVFCRECGGRLSPPGGAGLLAKNKTMVAEGGSFRVPDDVQAVLAKAGPPAPPTGQNPHAPNAVIPGATAAAQHAAPAPAQRAPSRPPLPPRDAPHPGFGATAPPSAGASMGPMTAPAGGAPAHGSEAPPPPGGLPPQGALRGVSTKPCRACGGVNGPSARFCQLCGVPLEGGSGERPRSRPPAPGPGAVGERLPEADLVVIAQDGSPGRRYALSKSLMTVGSGSTDISLRKDPYVSPTHAEISYRNGRFSIKDAGSENGVFVRLSGSVALNSGDLLLLGLAVLRFETVAESERNLTAKSKNGVRVFGTPPTPRYAKVTVVTVEDQPRDVYYLSRAETVLGREVGDIVFTDDPFMSRRHAAIRRDPNTNLFSIRDLGSSNGTFLAIRASHALSSGDYVRIGQHLFRLDVRRD